MPAPEAVLTHLPPFEYYSDVFRRRDLFSPIEKREPVALSEGPVYRVMGLMFGLCRSVVLEDIRTKRTLFLVEGESQEMIWVRKINKEEVILEVSGESVVLGVKGQM